MRTRICGGRESRLKPRIDYGTASKQTYNAAMDIPTALVAITELIALFRQEKTTKGDATHREFIEWLEYHRHQELKELITHTFHLSSEVDALLRADQSIVLEQLKKMNAMIVDILSHVEPFKNITNTMIPDAGLSANAVQILTQFLKSGASVMVQTDWDRVEFAEVGGGLKFPDRRFLADDLATLQRLGLIAVNELSGSNEYYRLTRRAEQLVKLLSERTRGPVSA
jgi:hypothetical protein